MSFLINSTRFVTLFFTSTSSCFTNTGPINLYTDASSSSRSSSCTRHRARASAGCTGDQNQRRACWASGRERQACHVGALDACAPKRQGNDSARSRGIGLSAGACPSLTGAGAHLEHHLILEDLRSCGGDLRLHLANFLLDGSVRIQLRLELVATGLHGHTSAEEREPLFFVLAEKGVGKHTATWSTPLPIYRSLHRSTAAQVEIQTKFRNVTLKLLRGCVCYSSRQRRVPCVL